MTMDMGSIINQLLVLVSIMMLGFILGRRNIIDKNGNATISKLVINVAGSANVCSALLASELDISGKDAVTFIFIVFGCFALYLLVGIFYPRFIAAPKEDLGVYQFMVVFSNCGYMGYPVARAVFGEVSVIYVTYFVIIFNVITYSLGIAMLTRGKGKFNPKVLLSPIQITTAISLIIFAFKIQLPQFILDTATMLSQIMTPLAMLVIGVSLSQMRFKDLLGEWRVIPAVVMKLIVMPVLVWFILGKIISDPLMLGIATVISGMPIASAGTMLCIEHGVSEKLMAKTTFITNILTAFTIPLIVYLLL